MPTRATKTVIEVHGYAKKGAGFGYSRVRGLNALLASVHAPTSRNCAYLPASSGYRVVMDVLTTDTFPVNALVDATLTGTLSARESAAEDRGLS